MVKTDAQKRAAAKYEAKARQLCVKFYPPDYELYDWLKSKPNASGYLKELARREMASGR